MFIAGANNYKEDDGVFHVWAHGELDVIHVYDKSKGENIPIRTREKFNTFMNENSEVKIVSSALKIHIAIYSLSLVLYL